MPGVDLGVLEDRDRCPRPASDTSPDLGADEYDPGDCNRNCVADHEDILIGTSIDDDDDGVPDECRVFRRGDVDSSGAVDVTDALVHLRFLFLGQGEIPCDDAADSSDDGQADLTDSLRTLTFWFLGGFIASPGILESGPDPTADALGCASYPAACD